MPEDAKRLAGTVAEPLALSTKPRLARIETYGYGVGQCVAHPWTAGCRLAAVVPDAGEPVRLS